MVFSLFVRRDMIVAAAVFRAALSVLFILLPYVIPLPLGPK